MVAVDTNYNYLVIDIETGYAADAFIQKSIDDWSPPKNIKDEEKIAARRADFVSEARLKSAVSDHAPIKSVAVKGRIDGELIKFVFGAMGVVEGYATCEGLRNGGWEIVDCANELELLKAFGAAMDSIVVSDIVLAGHNIKKFDLPKLRTRTLYSKLSLPLILKPQQFYIFDTMLKAPYFLVGCGEYVSFEKLEHALGITEESHKNIMCGSKVPEMAHLSEAALDTEQYEEWQSLASLIMTYNAKDVVQEEKAFELMCDL